MTFWSGDKLRATLDGGALIVHPYHWSKIDCSSYTLTLGSEAFVTPDHEIKPRDNKKLYLDPARKEYLDDVQKSVGGGSINIPAGQFAFLLTEEYLDIPHNVMGFISLKSGAKWKGLINVSGFHVDPRFRGRLVYSVYNAGPSSIPLSRGDDLFLLWLADLDPTASEKYSRAKKQPNIDISNDLISKVNYPIHSLQQLSIKIDEIEREHKFFRRAVYTIVVGLGLLASLAGIIIKNNLI